MNQYDDDELDNKFHKLDRSFFSSIPFACILKTRSGFTKIVMFSAKEFKQFALDGYKHPFSHGESILFRLKYNYNENGFFVFEEW